MEIGGGLENSLGLCHCDSLLPHKELLLDRIKFSNVPSVSAMMGFAVRYLQSW